jgi:hypothetical protein
MTAEKPPSTVRSAEDREEMLRAACDLAILYEPPPATAAGTLKSAALALAALKDVDRFIDQTLNSRSASAWNTNDRSGSRMDCRRRRASSSRAI